MASLWQFGNEFDGLLIVAADSKEEAIALRTEWFKEQKRRDKALAKWWKDVKKYMKPTGGWIEMGVSAKLAEEEFGPRPEGGIMYYQNDLKDDPIDIGKHYAYQWFE